MLRTSNTKWRFVVAMALLVGLPCARGAPTEGRTNQRPLNPTLLLLAERCKTAGETVSQVVPGVEGIVWMRARDSAVNLDDQFRLDDPYGRDCTNDFCIANLLRATSGFELNPEVAAAHTRGYRFVETTDPATGEHFRYTASIRQGWNIEAIERYKKQWRANPPRESYRFQLDRIAIPKLTARYGVTWADISTHEDRKNWVAGGALRVVDLKSNIVIAERIGYLADRGRGSRNNRLPWAIAQEDACPAYPPVGPADSRRVIRNTQTLDFVLKTLQPL